MKFVSCSDDNTAKIFDFATAKEEFSFTEHKNNVQSCEWHPTMSLVITGSKDQTVKIWDPRSGGKGWNEIAASHNMISCVRWNPINGNWFLTGSKDCHIKVYDLRKPSYEINVYACKEDPV
jgi:polyadenylation factor subunit 2